ncbi:hypothetical protein D3C87_1125430 [compost metagenome]
MQLSIGNLPQRHDAACVVQLCAQVRIELIVLVRQQVGQDLAPLHPMFVVQGDARPALQRDFPEPESRAIAPVRFLAAVALGQRQFVARDAHQRQVFDGVVMELARLRERVVVATAVGAVIA